MNLKDIKEKLSSVVFMGFGAFIAIIAVFIMFAPAVEILRDPLASTDLFWNGVGKDNWAHGAWPVFVGYMLILVGALIMGIIALPVINISARDEKICLFVAIGALVVGGILVMCVKPILIGVNSGININPAWITSKAGPFVAGSFALVAAACGGAAVAMDW